MRLKEKDGTYRTFVRISVEDNLTVPICVTGTKFPFGSLTSLETEAITVVNNEKEQIIWSVAPVSMIQEQEFDIKAFLKEVMEEKTKWRKLGAVLGIKELPDMLATRWLAELTSEEGVMRAMSF
jgi:DNA-binding phage protein